MIFAEIAEAFNVLKANPILGGSVSLLVAGAVGYMLTKLPLILFNRIKEWFVVSLTISNMTATSYDRDDSHNMYLSLLAFISRNFKVIGRREFQCLDYQSTKTINGVVADSQISIGLGKTLAWYNGRLYWYNIEETLVTGQRVPKTTITLSTFGFSPTKIKLILDTAIGEYMSKELQRTIPRISLRQTDWIDNPSLGLDSVILNDNTKKELIGTIDWFLANEEWYRERGIPYKLIIVLYGVAGTGKTSIIRAIGKHFHRDIISENMALMNDDNFSNFVYGNYGTNPIIVFEDFEGAGAVKTRKGVSNIPTRNGITHTIGVPEDDDRQEMSFLSLSTILNTFDGLMPLDKKIIFLTTNTINNIDPALLRAGRVDKCIEIKPFEHAEVIKYIRQAFPKFDVSTITDKFDQITGARVQELFLQNPSDAEAFVASLPRTVSTPISRALDIFIAKLHSDDTTTQV